MFNSLKSEYYPVDVLDNAENVGSYLADLILDA